MASLGEELRRHYEAIVEEWLRRWRASGLRRAGLGEAALKDHLPTQLRLIGEQLDELANAEVPDRMWKITERLNPEARVDQSVPIEEVVQEYGLLIDVIRDWIEEREIEVAFADYSYLHQAVFELTAESVRRYAGHQAEKVRQARSQYLAGLMHQLRSPLTVLSMQLDLLEQSGAPITPEGARRSRRSIRRVVSIVDGVLRLERFEPHQVPLRPERFAVADLVDDLLQDVDHEARRKGLRLVARVQPGLEVTLDPDLVSDGVGNLLHNAVKFSERGEVVVEASREGDGVVVRIADTGPGLTAEQQATLFEEPQIGRAGGFGIGLLIACHAIRAQGGTIEVDSAPGRGSTLTVRLPREVARRDSPDREPSSG